MTQEWTYEDRVRIECVADLKDELLRVTNEIIKMHGADPDMDMVLAAAYYGAIIDIGNTEHEEEKPYEKVPEAILLMIGSTYKK